MEFNQNYIILEILIFAIDLRPTLKTANDLKILKIDDIKRNLEFLQKHKLTAFRHVKYNIDKFVKICKNDFGLDLIPTLKEVFENEVVTDQNLTWHDGEKFVANYFWTLQKGKFRRKEIQIEYDKNKDELKVTELSKKRKFGSYKVTANDTNIKLSDQTRDD